MVETTQRGSWTPSGRAVRRWLLWCVFYGDGVFAGRYVASGSNGRSRIPLFLRLSRVAARGGSGFGAVSGTGSRAAIPNQHRQKLLARPCSDTRKTTTGFVCEGFRRTSQSPSRCTRWRGRKKWICCYLKELGTGNRELRVVSVGRTVSKLKSGARVRAAMRQQQDACWHSGLWMRWERRKRLSFGSW